MRAIILAAGRGSRMKKVTNNIPKCLLEVKGKKLLELQIQALKKSGIRKIGIITGYLSDQLSNYSEKTFHNDQWNQTNMVFSLMCAQKWLKESDCIVSYSDIFYDLSNSYYYQNSYCEGGDPAGYIYSNYSIARHKTTSSVVMKSIPGNLNDSFILTALGNPLFSPYVPIKIADFEQVNSQDFLQISQDSQSLFDYFFDWNEGFVDSHHLIPSNLSDYQSHDGAFSDLKNNIESQYVDFLDGILISDFNSSLELISGFYEDFLEGFVNEGYDAPQYKVNAHNLSVESCEEDIFPSYKARRIIDQTFHRNHSGSYVFKVEQSSNSANSFIVPVLDGNVNPIITQDHWSLIPSQSDVDVYLIDSASNQILASFLDKPIGCTNDTYIEYDSSNRIDDGSCGNLGDINTDGALDVLDVVEIMNLVLEGEYYHIADINNDGFVNVLDILQIVNFILS